MKRIETFWHLAGVTLLGLPLISPLLMATAVPCTHDGHLHYHRIAAMRHAWENGLTFSRWLPDVAFGLGYPFFVYREPTPLYASLFPHLLGLPLPAAENLFYAVSILACGWFMYLWVRDILGARAGVVSAMAYMAAPYVLVDALVRGNSPESLALPLLPLLLWIGRRWIINGRLAPFLTATFGLAFFSLSHNISLLIFTPVLFVYLIAVGGVNHIAWRPLLLRLLLLFVLGLGMTIFYSGGALLELNSVTLEQSVVTRNNDFRFNFVSAAELFGPVAPEDPTLLNPVLRFRIGWVPFGLAVLGVVYSALGLHHTVKSEEDASIYAAPREQKLHVWLMVAATAVFLFMAFPASRTLWEGLPLIDFVQFPWRFVGRAALPVAFLAGVPFSRSGRVTLILIGLALLLLFIETVPNLYPNVCPEEPFPTINTVHTYERVTGLVGVDPEGSYFPRTVKTRPSGSILEPDYRANQFPQRFTLPEGVMMMVMEVEPLGGSVRVAAEEPFTAVYQTFFFDGWTAIVDGARVPIAPSDPGGLITFPVPAGTHLIEVRWQSTTLRSALLGISLFALAWTGVVALVLMGQKREARRERRVERKAGRGLGLVLLGVGLLMVGLKLGFFDRVGSPLRREGALGLAQNGALSGGELRLMSDALSQRLLPSDGILVVDMAWTAVAPPSRNYQTNVWLEDESGQLWSIKNTFRPRDFEDAPPTLAWQPGQWGWESWEVEPLSGTPPGSYSVMMTLFDLETLQPVTLFDTSGAVLGPTAVLGEVVITEPEEPPIFAPQFVLDTAVFNTGLHLIGYNQDRSTAQPGETMLVTLFAERIDERPVAPLTLALQNDTGRTLASWPIDIAREAEWDVGTRLRGQKLLQLPGGLESGTYRFVLNKSIPLGELSVTSPQRTFEQPTVETTVNASFTPPNQEPIATLIGYEIPNSQSPIPITLVWRAESETTTSYRVFVHLVDAAGSIVAQSDGVPAQWTRPTTSWAAGEYIVDTHPLTLPDDAVLDDLQIRIGLYDENGRLTTETGDFVPIDP